MKTHGFGLGANFAQRAAASAPHSSRYSVVEATNERREGDNDDSIRSEGGGTRLFLVRHNEALRLEDV